MRSLDLVLELGIRHGLVTKPLPLLYVRPAAIDPCNALHDLRAAARDYRAIDRMMAVVASILLPFFVNNPDAPNSTHERRRGTGNAENMLPLIIGEWQAFAHPHRKLSRHVPRVVQVAIDEFLLLFPERAVFQLGKL